MNINHRIVDMFKDVVSTDDNRLFLVGGTVRDILLGRVPEDIDLCVVGGVNDIINIFGEAHPAHHDAPVFQVNYMGLRLDVALARSERSTGPLSESFLYSLVGSIEEDLERRDVTINAMAIRVSDGLLIDPFGGLLDLQQKRLHPVSESFAESAERLGRVAALVAIFGFEPSDLLISVCRNMAHSFALVSKDQMFKQFWGKALVRGKYFSKMFQFLIDSWGIFATPQLGHMHNCEQNLTHHPEGNVLNHVGLVLDALGSRHPGRRLPLYISGALLVHDMGKVVATYIDAEKGVVSPGHEHEHEMAREFLTRIGFPKKLFKKVFTLVDLHMRRDIPTPRAKGRVLRKLAEAGLSAQDLFIVQYYDGIGRGPGVEHKFPQGAYDLIEFEAEFLRREAEVAARGKNILTGHDIMRLGVKQGPEIGRLLRIVQEAFMANEIETKDDAFDLVRLNL